MKEKNMDKNASQTTDIVMDALKRSGISVVPVTDEYARRFIREHERADKAQFRLVGQEILYSNARAALDSIRQEKATPAQWLAMLTKAGGIKAGEDRWTGLSEWLSGHPAPSIDKQEITAYLDAHCISLHEEHFHEIEKTGHFKELQQEFLSLADAVNENYIQAENAYEEFMERMKEQYGDEWEYEMSSEESDEEYELIEERDKWNTDSQSVYEIAFQEMTEKYNGFFEAGFHVNHDSLEVYNVNEAQHFIADWVVDEARLECTTAGLDNYQELAFWVEDIKSWEKTNLTHFGEVGNGRCIGWVRFGDMVESRALSDREIQQKLDMMPGLDAWTQAKGAGLDGADLYFPPGYDSSRPYSHIMQRKGERTAQYVPYRGSATICHSLKDAVQMYNRLNVPKTEDVRVLVIDEIQSQRHQEGRKNGYRMTEKEMQQVRENYSSVYQEMTDYENTLKKKYNCEQYGEHVNPQEQQTLDDYRQRLRTITDGLLDEDKKVERAPFEKNWHELCMKRMLRYAAEKGYDKLAWTTGEQQGLRYNPSKYIHTVRRGADDTGGRFYEMDMPNNQYTHIHTDEQGIITHSAYNWDGKHLREVFGEEWSKKMMEMQPETTMDTKNIAKGSKGMHTFYDTVLPLFVNKYGKRWGVTVQPLELTSISHVNEYNDKPLTMHSIDVTPEMKRLAVQPQPMFMKNKQGEIYGWTLDGTIYLTPRGMNAETGIHEYTHLWAEIMKQKDKLSWEHIKTLLKDTPVWKQVMHDRNYRNLRGDEDRIASEVLARTSGRDNAEKLEQAVRQATSRDRSIRGLEQLKQALGKFWSWVGRHIFHIRQARTITDVTDSILGDLLRGTKPERPARTGHVTDVQLKMFGQQPNQIPRIRCKIDGQQQMYTDITRREAEAVRREQDPQKQADLLHSLSVKYFSDQLKQTQSTGMKR